jgi:hypothetical protein
MKNLQNIFAVLLFSTLNLACGVDLNSLEPEGNGVVSIHDETVSPGWGFGDKVVAKGATLHLAISEPNISRTQIRIDDPTIFSIEKTETIGPVAEDELPSETRLTLKALDVGETRIHIDLGDGRTDFKTIRVSEANSHTVRIYPWHDFFALDESLWENGFTLLPNTNLTLFGSAYTKHGNQLSGFDSAAWQLESTGDARIDPSENSDYAVFKSGTELGDSVLRFGNSDATTFSTIPPSSVTRIELIRTSHNDAVTYTGESVLFHAALFSADGAYVSGIGDHAVEYETTDNASATRPLLFERAYRVGRAVDFAAQTSGVHTLTARWGNLSTSIDIEVLDRPIEDGMGVD